MGIGIRSSRGANLSPETVSREEELCICEGGEGVKGAEEEKCGMGGGVAKARVST